MGIAADLEKINSGQDTEERHNRIIRAKIDTKKAEIKTCGQGAPLIIIIVGVVGLFFIWYIAVFFIAAGALWSTSRANQETKLKNEVKELEAELV